MICAACGHGQTHASRVTITLQKNQKSLAIEGVPVELCDHCGEYFLSQYVAQQVLSQSAIAYAEHYHPLHPNPLELGRSGDDETISRDYFIS